MNCAMCGAPATAHHSLGGRSVPVCARCLDRQELQDALEARLPELHRLTTGSDWAGALALLDGLLAAHGTRDHDGWLARSVLAHRALILEEKGDLDAALEARSQLLERGIPDASEELAERLGLANLLERLGRLEDAAEAAEQALTVARGPAGGAIAVLARYHHICEQLGRSVPTQHRALLVEALARWGLSLDAALVADPAPLGPAIVTAETELHRAQARFHALQVDLQQRPPEQRPAALDAYVAQEPVGLFRRMAEDLRRRS